MVLFRNPTISNQKAVIALSKKEIKEAEKKIKFNKKVIKQAEATIKKLKSKK